MMLDEGSDGRLWLRYQAAATAAFHRAYNALNTLERLAENEDATPSEASAPDEANAPPTGATAPCEATTCGESADAVSVADANDVVEEPAPAGAVDRRADSPESPDVAAVASGVGVAPFVPIIASS